MLPHLRHLELESTNKTGCLPRFQSNSAATSDNCAQIFWNNLLLDSELIAAKVPSKNDHKWKNISESYVETCFERFYLFFEQPANVTLWAAWQMPYPPAWFVMEQETGLRWSTCSLKILCSDIVSCPAQLPGRWWRRRQAEGRLKCGTVYTELSSALGDREGAKNQFNIARHVNKFTFFNLSIWFCGFNGQGDGAHIPACAYCCR